VPDEKPIKSAVSALVDQFGDGIAIGYPKYRHIQFGHIFSPSSKDAVAFFAIEGFEGTNDYAEYLAVFQAIPPDSFLGRATRPYRLIAVMQIGGKSWRIFDWEAVVLKHESITVAGTKWVDGDAGCCPSQPITVTFRVQHGSMREAP